MCLYEKNKILIMLSNTINIVNIDTFEITTITIKGIGHTRCIYPSSNNIYFIGNNCGMVFKFYLDEIININNKLPQNNIKIANIRNLEIFSISKKIEIFFIQCFKNILIFGADDNYLYYMKL